MFRRNFVYENLHADSLQYHPDIDGMVASIEKKATFAASQTGWEMCLRRLPVALSGDRADERNFKGARCGQCSDERQRPHRILVFFTDDQNAKEAYEAMQEAGLARQLFLTGFADGRGREE